MTFSNLDDHNRNRAAYLAIQFLFSNVSPEDPEQYTSGSGYEITYVRLNQICDLLERSSADWLIYQTVERAVDCLVSKKNEERLKSGQKDELFRRLHGIVEDKLPDPKHIRHEGYRIIAQVQLNRYRETTDLKRLVEKAREVPNQADRGLVLYHTAVAFYKIDRGAGQRLINEAVEIVRGLASKVDQLERFLWFAEMVRAVASPISRQMLIEAVRVFQAPDEEAGQKIRRIIDLAYKIDEDFASDIADRLDDDKAKRNAKREMDLLKVKQRVIDEDSIPDSVRTAAPGEYVSLGEMLLGSLQSEKIDRIRGSSALKCIDVACKQPLSVSYLLMAWIIQNGVDRHADTNRASFYLRPTFEAVLTTCQLAGELADQTFSRARSASNRDLQNDSKNDNVSYHNRETLLNMLARWLSEYAGDSVVICDPNFGREDLELLRLIRAANPQARISVLSDKRSQTAPPIGLDLEQAYLEFWKDHISEQRPPVTRISLLSTNSQKESPLKDVAILGDSVGLGLEASFRAFGNDQQHAVRHLDNSEAEFLCHSIEEYCSGSVLDNYGARIRCSTFSL